MYNQFGLFSQNASSLNSQSSSLENSDQNQQINQSFPAFAPRADHPVILLENIYDPFERAYFIAQALAEPKDFHGYHQTFSKSFDEFVSLCQSQNPIPKQCSSFQKVQKALETFYQLDGSLADIVNTQTSLNGLLFCAPEESIKIMVEGISALKNRSNLKKRLFDFMETESAPLNDAPSEEEEENTAEPVSLLNLSS